MQLSNPVYHIIYNPERTTYAVCMELLAMAVKSGSGAVVETLHLWPEGPISY
jgi:hypothetical protein